MSVHIAAFPNRTKQTFGVWIVFRNIAEVAAHLGVAVMAVDWFWYYMLLYRIVAHRYLDVGPRRLLYALYDTEAKRRARPWAPPLSWAVIVAHAATTFDWVAVVAVDAAVLVLFAWLGRGYRRSLARRGWPRHPSRAGSLPPPVPLPCAHVPSP